MDNLLICILTSIVVSFLAAGVGVFVVLKRYVFIGGGISHAAFGGIAACIYFGISEIWGGLLTAFVFSLVLVWFQNNKKINDDNIIGLLWVLGVAIGGLFMTMDKARHEKEEIGIVFSESIPTTDSHSKILSHDHDHGSNDLGEYQHHHGNDKHGDHGHASEKEESLHSQHHAIEEVLFGDIKSVTWKDFYLILGISIFVLLLIRIFFYPFAIIAFDEEYARTQGVPVLLFNGMFILMVSMSIVALLSIVGVTLVMALLTIPTGIALMFTKNLKLAILFSTFIGISMNGVGILLAQNVSLSIGPVIILVGVVLYFMAYFIKFLTSKRSQII